ncbi:MAG: hypothetical protein J3K34DRAFT_267735 [Monoraphidium minutum]|nr:MAG: hypothetical protein J3K34DRAFT_267735 [Monoraphidium minutum]
MARAVALIMHPPTPLDAAGESASWLLLTSLTPRVAKTAAPLDVPEGGHARAPPGLWHYSRPRRPASVNHVSLLHRRRPPRQQPAPLHPGRRRRGRRRGRGGAAGRGGRRHGRAPLAQGAAVAPAAGAGAGQAASQHAAAALGRAGGGRLYCDGDRRRARRAAPQRPPPAAK